MNKFFLLFLIIFSLSSYGEWKRIYKSSPGETYIDFDTMKFDGDIIEYWMKKNFSKKTDGVMSARAQVKLNCQKNSYEIIFYTAYSKKNLTGKVIYNANPHIQETIVAFSPEQAVKEAACK